ncbi:MAG: hypothetical protein INR65_00015 [Gluconacetobacter diazotrophicus]|nr:hypothetical protein [Gluconacetobacter diazotrophicus]
MFHPHVRPFVVSAALLGSIAVTEVACAPASSNAGIAGTTVAASPGRTPDRELVDADGMLSNGIFATPGIVDP